VVQRGVQLRHQGVGVVPLDRRHALPGLGQHIRRVSLRPALAEAIISPTATGSNAAASWAWAPTGHGVSRRNHLLAGAVDQLRAVRVAAGEHRVEQVRPDVETKATVRRLHTVRVRLPWRPGHCGQS
jgi:hypothetical protein